MVFSSHIFIFYFLALVLSAYYLTPKSWRHLVLTLASYAFYGWWNPWVVFLMLASTWIDYRCGKIISAGGASPRARKTGLWTSIIVNPGDQISLTCTWDNSQGNQPYNRCRGQTQCRSRTPMASRLPLL